MGLSALVEDLHQRGLDRDVSVVVWGEFGLHPEDQQQRRPRSLAQRFLCAAGRRRECGTGQVIGATNRLGEVPRDRPVTFQNVFATLYHCLGINPATALPNHFGRPMPLLDEVEPIRELV